MSTRKQKFYVDMTHVTRIEPDDKPKVYRMDEYHGHGYAFILHTYKGSHVWFLGNYKGGLAIMRQEHDGEWEDVETIFEHEGEGCIGDFPIVNVVHRYSGEVVITLDNDGEPMHLQVDLLKLLRAKRAEDRREARAARAKKRAAKEAAEEAAKEAAEDEYVARKWLSENLALFGMEHEMAVGE